MLQTLYEGFLTSMMAAVNTITAQMAAALAGPITAAATIYIIGYGVFLMRGGPQGSALDFAIQALKLGIIVTLVRNTGEYNTWVGTTILTGIPDFVSSLSSGTVGTAPWDGIIGRAGDVADQIREQYSSFNVPGQIFSTILSAALYFTASFLAAIGVVVTLMANFGLALMAAVGPLFVAFALFDFTRGWFFSWLGQIWNFGLLQLLVSILTTLVVAFIGDVYTSTSGLEVVQRFVYMSIGLLISVVFFFLLPSIASSLTAGAQASTGRAQRALERGLLRGGRGGGGGRGRSGSAARVS